MNGKLELWLNERQYFVVAGGRYDDLPEGYIGVRMAKEINKPATIVVPTQDFKTPPLEEMTAGLDEAVSRILIGQPLYVGCMGGIGRTGLFLAVLAKAFGEPDPVGYVRSTYLSHAVETTAQQQYVADFVIPKWTQNKIAMARFLMRILPKNLLTRAV